MQKKLTRSESANINDFSEHSCSKNYVNKGDKN
jgi:hypothetical protein